MTPKPPPGLRLGSKSASSTPFQTAYDAARLARAGEATGTALEALDRAREAAGNEAQRAQADVLRAETLIDAGRLDEAEPVVARLQENAPGIHRLYAILTVGLLAQARGQRDAALIAYDRAQDAAHAESQPGPEARAACHRADIYWHDGNASYAAHVLREFLPRLTSPQDMDWSPYFVGRMGQALYDSGDEIEGHQLIARGLELAETAGSRKGQRMWSLALGELAAADRRYDDARPKLEAALTRMEGRPLAEVSHTRRLLAETCLALRDDAAASQYAEGALAAAVQSGDPALIAQARGVLGIVLRARGQTDDAIPHLQAAVVVNGTPDVRRALAAALAASGQHTDARALFEAAVRSAPEGSLEQAEARRDLGLYHYQRRAWNEAIVAWTPAAAAFELHHAYAAAARLHVDLAGARRALGQQTRGFKDIDQALTLLSHVPSTDDETRGVVLANAAAAYAEQGDVETADSFFNDSVVIAQRLGDAVAESTRSGNYGWFLTQVGRPRRAMANIELGLRISQRLGLTLQQAVQTDNLGLAYDAVADYSVALGHHRSALALIGEMDEPYWKASLQVNLAATLLQTGELAEAEILLDEALTYARAHPFTELLVRALIAECGLREKQGRPADAPVEEAVTLARRHELRRLLADALTAQSQRDAALGQMDSARGAWTEAARLYSALKMPQARFTPGWLSGKPG
jgi:tetratricopeptide (TPR) repeat protein